MLKIWGRRTSSNVQKVMWLVGELGLQHERIDAGGKFGGINTPEFLARNPHGQIPVIDDGGIIIWESHTILRYLAARYGAPRFWDSDPAVRAGAEQWMDWSQTRLEQSLIGGVFWGYYRTPESQRNWPAINRAIEECAHLFGLLDRELAIHPFVTGEMLTLADIPAGMTLYRYFELDIERPALPHVEAWYRRLQERPAYRAQVMVPFDELKGRLAF